MLVLAQAEIDRRTQATLPRPLRELDLRYESGLDPDDVGSANPRHRRCLDEW
jgi:hypothetical protein